MGRGSFMWRRGSWRGHFFRFTASFWYIQTGAVRGGEVMGWASGHIERLRNGETVSFRPRGHSMSGKIESGQLCTVAPVKPAGLRVGDIVLCKANGREYLHHIKAVQ